MIKMSQSAPEKLDNYCKIRFRLNLFAAGSGKMLPNRSMDGLSVSSSDNCEDSFAFRAEGTSAITLETISVKIFAL